MNGTTMLLQRMVGTSMLLLAAGRWPPAAGRRVKD
jgi:hypothetical protein